MWTGTFSISFFTQRKTNFSNFLRGIEIKSVVSTESLFQLEKSVCMWWSFPVTHPLQSGCPRCLPAARQTSLNHAAKWKSIYSWTDLSEMPKAYKNNGVCNIIPGTPNGNSLKGEISSIRQLHSSMHSRECGGKRVRCAHLPASGDPQPNLEYYKALPHYYSPLHYKPPSCGADGSAFLCM